MSMSCILTQCVRCETGFVVIGQVMVRQIYPSEVGTDVELALSVLLLNQNAINAR